MFHTIGSGAAVRLQDPSPRGDATSPGVHGQLFSKLMMEEGTPVVGTSQSKCDLNYAPSLVKQFTSLVKDMNNDVKGHKGDHIHLDDLGAVDRLKDIAHEMTDLAGVVHLPLKIIFDAQKTLGKAQTMLKEPLGLTADDQSLHGGSNAAMTHVTTAKNEIDGALKALANRCK